MSFPPATPGSVKRASVPLVVRCRALRRFAAWLGLAWLCAAHAAGPAPRPAVLVLLSYHVGMEWEDGVVAGLQEALAPRAELVLLQLDVKRYPQPEREPGMLANFVSKAAMCSPAAVIAVDDFAYQFALRHRDRMRAGTPLLFGGVNYLPGAPPPGVGGVVEAIDIAGTLRLLQTLRPDTERLVVVNDTTETGAANNAALDAALAGIDARWDLLRLGRSSFAETEAALAGLNPERDSVLLLSWNLDVNGVARSYDEAVQRARELCPAPLFGVWSFYFGHGIVGGSLLDGREHGRELGELAAQVLAGANADPLPVVRRCRTKTLADARELARFGIPESALPRGAELRFATIPFWREHPDIVAGITLVVVLQTLTIARLLVSRRRQRHAERQLRAGEADLRNVLDSIGDAVVVTDAAARVQRINPVAGRLAGLTVEAARGKAFGDVLRLREPGTETACPDPILRVLGAAPGSTMEPGRAELTSPDGKPVIVEYTAAPVRNEQGAACGAVLALRDVTAQQRTEAQLRQAQKMEAVGRLVGGVAHDFNNLLLVIRGSLELARQPGTDAQEGASYLHEVDEAARRAAELTQQLLAFSRQQKLQVRPIDLATLLAGMTKLVRRVLTESIRVEMRGPAAGCWANVDAGQIEQVIMNLCVNARDAMPDGGSIQLEIGRAQFAAADLASYPWTRPGDYHVLTVTDTGVGMDQETQRRIFEPFFSTKPVGRGTGLGLSVVQGIVQQHEGLINVYSEVGRGTTFRIYLPAIAAPTGEPHVSASGASEAKPDEGRGYTILLAEDEPAVRRIASGGLRSHGYRVLEVADGEEACAVAAAHSGPIAVAVLDVVMPRLGGPEAARRLQSLRPKLPILLCSGYPGTMPNEMEVPADWRWLAKPYPMGDLLARVRELRNGTRSAG
ncbi:MAG TPA: ATP-binding protein [Opitutaceae bacterium]|nr:ATP-binding protein [Opitutaceae bacterium]